MHMKQKPDFEGVRLIIGLDEARIESLVRRAMRYTARTAFEKSVRRGSDESGTALTVKMAMQKLECRLTSHLESGGFLPVDS